MNKVSHLPSCSVIIPCKNRQTELNRAIESVLSQSILPDEIIVVDDGSDYPLKVPSSTATPIQIIEHQFSFGASAARNTGIAHSSSEYCAFLDSDDFLDIKKLEEQLYAASIYKADFLYGKNILIYGNDHVLAKEAEFRELSTYSPYLDLINFYPIPNTSCLMIKRTLLIELNGFDTNLATCEDHDLWFRAAHLGSRFQAVQKSVSYFVQHTGYRLSNDIQKRMEPISYFASKRDNEHKLIFGGLLFANKYRVLILLPIIHSLCLYPDKKLLYSLIYLFIRDPLLIFCVSFLVLRKLLMRYL